MTVLKLLLDCVKRLVASTSTSKPATAKTSALVLRSRSTVGNEMVVRRFLAQVQLQKGKGEVGANNSGHVVAAYKRIDKWQPGQDLGAWCASGTSYCLELAHGGPSKAASYYGVSLAEWSRKRHGAKALFRLLAKRCLSIGPGEEPEPGMLALWSRGKAGSWQGHISPVIDVGANGTFTVMQFNRGGYPAIVHPSKHCSNEGGLLGFVRVS